MCKTSKEKRQSNRKQEERQSLPDTDAVAHLKVLVGTHGIALAERSKAYAVTLADVVKTFALLHDVVFALQ